MYRRQAIPRRPGSLTLIPAICGALLLSGCLLDTLGGAFSYRPEQMPLGLSPGARGLIERNLADIGPTGVVDYHVHILGLGAGGTGAFVNADMRSWLHPIQRFKFAIYMSASGIEDSADADRQYVERMVALMRHFGRQGRFYILAFDRYYDAAGNFIPEMTNLYVPNEYVFELAAQYPDLLVPVMSIHPYRADAGAELERWVARRGRILKWLPSAMGIDPSDPRIDPFYDRMAELGVVLLSHAGSEQAVETREQQALGNPLRLRRALDRGVTVIVGHCASLGEGRDLDHPKQPLVTNFKLFLRLMDEPRYRGRVFGEVSGLTQCNRSEEPLRTLLERSDLHSRLVNGSDYPIPAINALISTAKLERQGFITEQERAHLNVIYEYNPLLFDYVLRRTVRHPETGERFAPSVFVPNPALP